MTIVKPLKVNLPEEIKVNFQVKCYQNRKDMTEIVKKFISLYLADNEVLMPLLSE